MWHRGGTVGPDLCLKIPRPRAYVNPSGLTVADGGLAIPWEAAGNAVLPLASKTMLLATFLSSPCHFLPPRVVLVSQTDPTTLSQKICCAVSP